MKNLRSFNVLEEEQIERLIKISKEKPLLPEKFVPWESILQNGQVYLPEKLNSLQGLPVYKTLTAEQKLELGRHEVVQVMYSYAWSESLFCLFMNRYIMTLQPDNIEYRFLLRELIEEFRHQEMFAQAVKTMHGKPIKPTFWHNLFGKITAKYMPHDVMFISCLAVELVTDVYGDQMRKNKQTYLVLQKVSELHNIEEARHILFTENLLKRYTQKAGFLKRTFYSFLVAINVHFMRTMYVKQEIYERLGLADTKQLKKIAWGNYIKKFNRECLHTSIQFTNSFNGFNWLSKFLWKWILKADVDKISTELKQNSIAKAA